MSPIPWYKEVVGAISLGSREFFEDVIPLLKVGLEIKQEIAHEYHIRVAVVKNTPSNIIEVSITTKNQAAIFQELTRIGLFVSLCKVASPIVVVYNEHLPIEPDGSNSEVVWRYPINDLSQIFSLSFVPLAKQEEASA